MRLALDGSPDFELQAPSCCRRWTSAWPLFSLASDQMAGCHSRPSANLCAPIPISRRQVRQVYHNVVLVPHVNGYPPAFYAPSRLAVTHSAALGYLAHNTDSRDPERR
jgi:hypothetical protein